MSWPLSWRLALQEAPVSPIRVTAWLLMSLYCWRCSGLLGQIDIVATAQGKVVPSDRVKTIQPIRETATVIQGYKRRGVAGICCWLDATEAQADLSQRSHDSENGRL